MIHLQAFNDFYNLILEKFDSAALSTHEGALIHVKSNDPADYDSLWYAMNTCYKYFPLNVGDVAFLNDPYSGGTTLDRFTFVTTLIKPQGSTVGLRLALRYQPKYNFHPQPHIESEGLRIPPTPLVTQGVLNEALVEALATHPLLAPMFSSLEFKSWLIEAHEQISALQKHFSQLSSYYREYLNQDTVQMFLDESKKWALKKITEHPVGENRATLQLSSGEILTAKIEVSDSAIQLDFGGTSAGKKVFLTDAMTFGPCYEVISQHYGFNELKNSGSYSVLKILKPLGCFVNAKFPSPTMMGQSVGAAALQSLTQMLIMKLETKLKRALPNFDKLSLRFDFADLKRLSLSLPAGGFATDSSHGHDGLFNSHLLNHLVVQDLEAHYPLKVLAIQPREDLPEAKSKYRGGAGVQIKLLALDDGALEWSSLLYETQWNPPKQLTVGATAQILINGKKQSLNQLLFKRGDQIELMSGHGGCWKGLSSKA